MSAYVARSKTQATHCAQPIWIAQKPCTHAARDAVVANCSVDEGKCDGEVAHLKGFGHPALTPIPRQ